VTPALLLRVFLLPVVDLIVSLFSYQMNATGYASLTVDASVFFNTKFEDQMQYTFLVNVNETEEGTGELLADLNHILYHLYKTCTLSHKVNILLCLFGLSLADVMVSKSAMVSFTNKALYLLEGSN